MKKIITFGELLMRFTPACGCKIGQTNHFNSTYGGSEANVAAALALYGVDTSFVSKLPDNPIGRDVFKTMRYYGVGTEHLELVRYGRMGVYYLEPGYGGCSRVCTYDRRGSSIAMATRDCFNWEHIFKDAVLFHFSGITPALSEDLQKICRDAAETARKNGMMVSCDINYRSKLWDKHEASAVMRRLSEYADILFINEEEASLLGFDASGESLMDIDTFMALVRHLSGETPASIITTAARVPLDNGGFGIQAVIWNNEGVVQSEIYPLSTVIDPNGAGDAYAAAVLYGILRQMPMHEVVNLGAAACCLKHYCFGDINLATLNEIRDFSHKHFVSGLKR